MPESKHDLAKCEVCRMHAIAKVVHRECGRLTATAMGLSKSSLFSDHLLAGALQIGVFAAHVIVKAGPCSATATVSAESLGLASSSLDEMLAELVARLSGGRRSDSMDTRRN